MEYFKKFKFIIFIFVFLLNCISLQKLEEEKNLYDRFNDIYKESVYTNNSLKFKIFFDNNWQITAKFEQFNKFQKTYTKYFSSQFGEVLFIGYNKEKNLGIRATCETLNMTNEDYFNLILSSMPEYNYKYKLKIVENQDILLKQIKVKHVIIKFQINSNNIFIFDIILFKLDKNNIRIDIWTHEKNYEKEKDYIYSIYNSISLLE